MKKNKGFTLIELLAVIVILGILMSITSVSVNSLRKKQDEKNKLNVISSILTGAKEYNAKNKMQTGYEKGVSVEDLKNGGYVDFDENKNEYEELLNKKVVKEQCKNNPLKIKYSIEIDEKTTYNDCGCEKQPEEDSDELSNELCK